MASCNRSSISYTIFYGCGRGNCENRVNINEKKDDDNGDDKIENQEEQQSIKQLYYMLIYETISSRKFNI